MTETLGNTATGTPATQSTERYFNLLGELMKSADGARATVTTDKVTTIYTYDGLGLPDAVSVWEDATPGSTATRGNSITTVFDLDVAGNRARVQCSRTLTVDRTAPLLRALRTQSWVPGRSRRDCLASRHPRKPPFARMSSCISRPRTHQRS